MATTISEPSDKARVPSTPLHKNHDRTSIRRSPELYGIETLWARYRKQTFKPHAHDEYLFGVIEGGTHAVWCRGELNQVPGGTVVTMRPGDIHHGGAGEDKGWSQRMLYIPEAGMRALLGDITGQEPSGTLDFAAAFHARPGLARRFSQLHNTLHSATEPLVRAQAMDALIGDVVLALAPDVKPATKPASGRIADALEYLDSRLASEVTLEELSIVAGLSRRQTIVAFRTATGLPPHAWHLQRRIEQVKRLLRDGVPAALAAAEAGFADQSHMGRHFRAIVGVTPAAYARG